MTDNTFSPLAVAHLCFKSLMAVPEGQDDTDFARDTMVASLFSIAVSLDVLAEEARNRIH